MLIIGLKLPYINCYGIILTINKLNCYVFLQGFEFYSLDLPGTEVQPIR